MIDWLNDPALQKLDPIKKELFRTAASKTMGKSGNSMATVMMSLITSANKKGIHFTPEEISLILSVMKRGKSPQEQQQIDRMVQMVMNMMKQYR